MILMLNGKNPFLPPSYNGGTVYTSGRHTVYGCKHEHEEHWDEFPRQKKQIYFPARPILSPGARARHTPTVFVSTKFNCQFDVFHFHITFVSILRHWIARYNKKPLVQPGTRQYPSKEDIKQGHEDV